MKTLTLANLITNNLNPIILSPPKFLSSFPSLSGENKRILYISRTRWFRSPGIMNLSSIKASSSPKSLNYGGWDDLRLGGDAVNSGESTQLREFLFSVGVDDKKHVFMFLLGLVCAFAVSRVRISSIIFFPASALVFAIGFSFGFVRGGFLSDIIAARRRPKEESFRADGEKLRNLVDFFDWVDGRVDKLKSDIRRAIDRNRVAVTDLENYLDVAESISSSASKARNVVESYIINDGNSNHATAESQKSNKKRKEKSDIEFDLMQFISGLSGAKMVNSKPNKVKDNIKQVTPDSELNRRNQEKNSSSGEEESSVDSVKEYKETSNSILSSDSSCLSTSDQDELGRLRMNPRRGKMSLGDMGATHSSSNLFFENEEYSYRNKRLQFMNNSRVSLNRAHANETKTWESQHNLLDSVDFSMSWKRMESEASFIHEQMLKKSSRASISSEDVEKNENGMYKSFSREEKLNPEYNPDLAESRSSVFVDDLMFDKYLTEANDLLKQAKRFLRNTSNEADAEIMLTKSADLLSKAVDMKPMSLLAVGQLGNTYLLHGELKLRASRELRSLLLRGDLSSVKRQRRALKGLENQSLGRDKIGSLLITVCEECEELLVKAGRKYRLALSIDGNDVRALYNWGLALSFRAQLIADIGPEAAFDADKIFLAAIDKFDAMMSKGNVYAPDALFRWGLALQQRSRLRPSNSKEKVKLLQQARRLYEDALDMDSDNHRQVRDALLSCVSELDYRRF